MITLGNILFFIIGLVIGASIMYGFELYQDWKLEKEQEEIKRAWERIKAEDEARRRHANETDY